MRALSIGRRSVIARLVLMLFIPHVLGCSATSHVPPGNGANSQQIVGLTTKSGREIQFAVPGAMIAHDTVFAVVKSGQLVLPLDSVRTLSVRRGSTGGTVALVIGIVALAAIAFAAGGAAKLP